MRATQKKYQSLQAEHHKLAFIYVYYNAMSTTILSLEDNKQQLQTRCDKLESTVKLLEEQLGMYQFMCNVIIDVHTLYYNM